MPAVDRWGIRSLGPVLAATILLAGCGGGGGGTSGGGPPPGPDITPPSVVSMQPADGTPDFDPGDPIRVVFSEPMNPATITSSTVRILAGGVPVTGNLAYGASYVVEVNTGATDAAGNALADTFTGTFATRGAPSADVWGMARLDNNFTVLYDNATRTATLSWSALSSLDNVLVSAYSMQDDPNTGGRVAVPWDNTSVRDGSGEFAFDNTFPSSTYSFTAEKRNETGPASRILCVTTLFFGGSSEIPITMQDVTPTPVESRLDRYCRGCHPDTPTRGKVQRCLHRSGMTPVNYRPDDNSVVTLEEYDRVTCESCHTAHRPTPYLYFLRLSHVDPAQGLLCTQCH